VVRERTPAGDESRAPHRLADGVARLAHISVAAVLQVGLEEQALDLAAFVLLLRLDLVEGELKGTGGSQPALKLSELDIRRGSVGRDRACSCHVLTVI